MITPCSCRLFRLARRTAAIRNRAIPITGFKWWNFTYPTIVDSGANAITDFDNATNGSVNFGGTVGLMQAAGET